jgi:hypothetical protein
MGRCSAVSALETIRKSVVRLQVVSGTDGIERDLDQPWRQVRLSCRTDSVAIWVIDEKPSGRSPAQPELSAMRSG